MKKKNLGKKREECLCKSTLISLRGHNKSPSLFYVFMYLFVYNVLCLGTEKLDNKLGNDFVFPAVKLASYSWETWCRHATACKICVMEGRGNRYEKSNEYYRRIVMRPEALASFWVK